MDAPLFLDPEPARAIAALDALAAADSAPASARIGLDRIAKLESAVIARLLAARKRTASNGGTFVLVATRRDLLATLKVTGLDTVFTIEAA